MTQLILALCLQTQCKFYTFLRFFTARRYISAVYMQWTGVHKTPHVCVSVRLSVTSRYNGIVSKRLYTLPRNQRHIMTEGL